MFQNQLSSVSVKKDNAFNFIRLVCCLIVIYQHTLVFSKGVMPLLSLNFAGGVQPFCNHILFNQRFLGN